MVGGGCVCGKCGLDLIKEICKELKVKSFLMHTAHILIGRMYSESHCC